MRILLLFMVCIAAVSCTAPVRHSLNEDFSSARPGSVAIAPVIGEAKDPAVRDFIRRLVAEKLKAKGYGVLPLDEVDASLSKLFAREDAEENFLDNIGRLGADSVFLVNVTEWDESLLMPYASLDVAMEFTLYGKDGKTLWTASYSTGESDFSADKEALSLGVIKTYEPRLERMAARMLHTLPVIEAERKPEEAKKFFDWL